ncbi:hypothetical protein BCF11_2543 [Collimonas sp. PA-H2]|uniref:sigma-70 family RNA polymerase sigma factor n=1 Tax=Collimonas sp. PA-H2 TaxID=1881062 RepID=UPI000C0042D6|nr:sigma-70 family RNA polymerase sigma factor [Collimonas sp. PA-H2]PFH10132.1 hypothetical protein BCF11_2543 [Collimonas sp. PA-H2]
MIVPLRKRKKEGDLYKRFPDIEKRLGELDLLSKEDLVDRCKLPKGHSLHVPSECVLYFVRRSSAAKDDVLFGQLFKVIAERIRRALPRAENPDGVTVSFTRSQIYEQVYDKIVTLLIEERAGYVERLDFFEISFNGGLAKLKLDAQDKAWKEENRNTELEADEDSGEIAAEVETAAGSYDPFAPDVLDDYIYRSRLAAAMDELSPLQRRIIEMWSKGIQIDSKDPDAVTIAKSLRKSEKTIRTHRDLALDRLRKLLTGGGK